MRGRPAKKIIAMNDNGYSVVFDSMEQAAAVLGVSTMTLRKKIDDGTELKAGNTRLTLDFALDQGEGRQP